MTEQAPAFEHLEATESTAKDGSPADEFNRRVVAHVRPPDWINPTPTGRYHLVVIGGGTAGLVSAAGAAGLGAKVALVEKGLLGGDCLNHGCVPSKALIASARRAAAVQNAHRFGIPVPSDVEADFGAVMSRMRRLRSELARHDSAARFRELGVDVYLGAAVFEQDGTAISVDDQLLHFRKAAICTGTRPAAPDAQGIEEAGYLTNETVFSLTARPRRLGVIGGGPIGCELAQAFARLGCEVTLLENAGRVLSKDDPDAARLIEAALARDGVRVYTQTQLDAVLMRGTDKVLVTRREGEEARGIPVDELLVAVGRVPNVEGLNLESARVTYDARTGVEVDDHLRTTNRQIFAAGDICSRYKFTHAADFMARIVIRNALFLGRARMSKLLVPWCTYTAPELAHVGLTIEEAKRQGIPIDTLTQDLEQVDRAVLDGETEGFVRLHLKRGTDRILGATIVAANAGELISEISVAMRAGIGLKGIGETIHPYPTQAEAIRKLADTFNRGRLTPTVKRLMSGWLSLMR